MKATPEQAQLQFVSITFMSEQLFCSLHSLRVSVRSVCSDRAGNTPWVRSKPEFLMLR